METERETSATWTEELTRVAKMLDGVSILGCIADNASNAQRSVQDSPGVSLRCLAHLANLLMKDLCSLFERQFDQVKELNGFSA